MMGTIILSEALLRKGFIVDYGVPIVRDMVVSAKGEFKKATGIDYDDLPARNAWEDELNDKARAH